MKQILLILLVVSLFSCSEKNDDILNPKMQNDKVILDTVLGVNIYKSEYEDFVKKIESVNLKESLKKSDSAKNINEYLKAKDEIIRKLKSISICIYSDHKEMKMLLLYRQSITSKAKNEIKDKDSFSACYKRILTILKFLDIKYFTPKQAGYYINKIHELIEDYDQYYGDDGEYLTPRFPVSRSGINNQDIMYIEEILCRAHDGRTHVSCRSLYSLEKRLSKFATIIAMNFDCRDFLNDSARWAKSDMIDRWRVYNTIRGYQSSKIYRFINHDRFLMDTYNTQEYQSNFARYIGIVNPLTNLLCSFTDYSIEYLRKDITDQYMSGKFDYGVGVRKIRIYNGRTQEGKYRLDFYNIGNKQFIGSIYTVPF